MMRTFWRIAFCTAALIGIALLATRPSKAQNDEFSSDYATFTEQMAELFKPLQDKKTNAAFAQDLGNFLNGCSQETAELLILTCNRLRKFRARPNPHYSQCISTFKLLEGNSRITGRNMEVWKKLLEEKIGKGGSINKVVQFLDYTQKYIADGIIMSTKAVKWKAANTNGITFEVEGGDLKLTVPETDLICFANNDSITVSRTAGSLTTADGKWTGSHGTITWERTGLDPKDVYATFQEYTIDMRSNTVEVPDAEFLNSKYMTSKLTGKVTYRCISRRTTHGAQMPQFETAEGVRMDIKNIFKDIDYNGGFKQTGASFIGSGSVWLPAEVTVRRGDQVMATFSSATFLMSTDRIESSKTEVKLKMDDDAITHPGLRFRYADKTRTIDLTRGHKGVERTTYRNSYHKVNMDIELMRWNVDCDSVILTQVEGAAQNVALFESQSYYQDEYFNKLWGMNTVHPFQQIADFVRYNGGGGFPVKDYADFIHQSLSETQKALLALSYDGFVDYYVERDVCRATDRLYDYLKFSLGKKDYDVIKFESLDTTGHMANGVLDLKTKDIRLNHVKGVKISDSQNIGLYPDSGRITLKKNRDFEFDGEIDAGMISLKGSGLYFSYDEYKIKMDSVERLEMQVNTEDLDRYGNKVKKKVRNAITDLSGTIQIDEPDNKSGRKKNTEYPRITSTKQSKVYFDDPSIQKGRYDKERFYFTLDPFEFTDINNVTYENTSFDGVLTSNIFPDIRQKLIINPDDHSMGFTQQAPEEGYPIYGGKARFFNTLELSNRGLNGVGEIEYLQSRAKSKDEFLFLLDKTEGYTQQFDIKKTTTGPTTFPGVELGANQILRDASNNQIPGQTWLEFYPEEDHLDVRNTKGNFMMFPTTKTETGFEYEMSGLLSVTPTGLKGIGKGTLQNSTIEGLTIEFTDHTLKADTSYFASYMMEDGESKLQFGELRRDIVNKHDRRLYNKVATEMRRKGLNAAIDEDTIMSRIARSERIIARDLLQRQQSSFIDFEKREGYFSFMANGGNELEISAVKFKTMVKNYTWNIDRNLQTIGQKGSKGNRFVCTKERGDSLNFMVPIATFNQMTNTLTCEDVEFINVADAKVNLDRDGIVSIHKNAQIDDLKNTKVEVKSDSVYHPFYRTTVTILGAKEYKGFGEYEFADKMGGRYTIFMSDIHTVDGITTAKGNIGDEIKFDNHFAFLGDAMILGTRQHLEFDGGARMLHNSKYGSNNYIRFTAVINPAKVKIPIAQRTYNATKGKDRNKGLEEYKAFYTSNSDSVHVYSTFFERYKDQADLAMTVPPEGYLFYNNMFDRFEVNTDKKVEDRNVRGSFVYFTPGEETVGAFGKIEPKFFFNKKGYSQFEIAAAGDITHNRKKNLVNMKILAVMDPAINTTIATMMYQDLMTSKAPKCDSTSTRFEWRMNELYDSMTVKQIRLASEMGLNPKTNLLPEQGPLFFIDNMDLTWSTPKRSYVCDTTVNIMFVKGLKAYRKVNLKSQILMRRNNSTRIKMLLTFDDSKWYYIEYRGNRGSGYNKMYIMTSNSEVMDLINNADKRDRRDRIKRIELMTATDEMLNNFKNNFGLNVIPSNPYAEYEITSSDLEPEEEDLPAEPEPEEEEPQEEEEAEQTPEETPENPEQEPAPQDEQ